jgi:hypothetical protein
LSTSSRGCSMYLSIESSKGWTPVSPSELDQLTAIDKWLGLPDRTPQPMPIAIAFFSNDAIRTFVKTLRAEEREDAEIEREDRLDREARAEADAAAVTEAAS